MSLTITTPRLELRVPVMEDAVAINDAVKEMWPELQLWMSWAFDGHDTLESTQTYIASVPEQIEGGGLPLRAFCRESGRFVLSTGITVDREIPTTGYWVAKEFLGKGYATEATNAVLRYAFYELRLPAVGIEYYEGNEKSRRVIEKLGFAFSHITHKTKARCLDGKLVDEHFYEMRDPLVLPELKVSW